MNIVLKRVASIIRDFVNIVKNEKRIEATSIIRAFNVAD